MSSIASEDGQPAGYGERGYRRRKLAEMATNLYRTSQQAVTDMRESYVQTRARMNDAEAESRTNIHIPGAFPDAAITVQGDEQMVLFPSYAKRHIKRDWSQFEAKLPVPEREQDGPSRDPDYWQQRFEMHDDERAVVDVDVRGWIYTPQSGPMTRRNRILIGLARQLSGISAPKTETHNGTDDDTTPPTHHQIHEEQKEQEKINQEAAIIERRGRQEKQIAGAGGYSEESVDSGTASLESWYPRRSRRGGSQTPESAPSSPLFAAKQQSSFNPSELSDAELALANANLMARIAPFMTNPMIGLAVTIFFYNQDQSQSRTVLTDDSGHFSVRAALEFVPTHVRVLGNENLSATQEIKITEPQGVSLISDIDDTVKKSNISSGTREIFRNTFVRELADLTIEGVQDWYTDMHQLGVSFHYCSNSPWQLFPVLASFFKLGGLPPGSLHLKQYSGMLQGIFEPIAERKKGTLTKLLTDFPNRKFLLVGDSGEADLEVYTDLTVANPGRILAIFIRDVTTTERPGYFDSAYDFTRRRLCSLAVDECGRPLDAGGANTNKPRQHSAPAGSPVVEEKPSSGPAMGTLIDFSEDLGVVVGDGKSDDATRALAEMSKRKTASAVDLLGRKAAPPPRPVKPAALRGSSSSTTTRNNVGVSAGVVDCNSGIINSGITLPKLPPRIMTTEPTFTESDVWSSSLSRNPLSLGKTRDEEDAMATFAAGMATDITSPPAPPPPPPPLPRRRRQGSLRSLSPRLFGGQVTGRGASLDSDVDFEPLPCSVAAATGGGGGGGGSGRSLYDGRPSSSWSRTGTGTSAGGSPVLGAQQQQGGNRKQELWRRRVARAHEQLDSLGVRLYTWRRGQDVSSEAAAIIKRAMEDKGGL